ncbi:LOG family protein [Nocardioides lianchengensis]|uniref:Predicted Rossmann fold nucleotide-binding protein n=1 Tax=Nocardioides lianchengensis TaxID=1045774 RepID=A0A1G6N819_9ACTN|nr:LOG family protein [Nocardioides lianchengensis]NYG10690.1 putative Rossmann-fold nucleotide-binding protein [Nocardioides lianchengensis]SDC63990.1 Predicted Rossmann fold nucleotide-binding protein [Nocardioides lianchengensis]
MKRTRGRIVHVESLADLDHRLAAGARRLSGWRVRSVDLTDRTAELQACRVAGASFLGCRFAPGVADEMTAAGALVLPAIPDVPVDVHRGGLYSPADLYDTPSYDRSLDARAYAWAQRPGDAEAELAKTLHDHAIDQALQAWTDGRHLVGVMGGHAALRGEQGYDAAARLGHLLGATHVVATGGGPGAMEAANLGARLADRPAAYLDDALAELAATPSYRPSVTAWADSARAVAGRFPTDRETLGIPTWHYGHEPPNLFATAIAKYFRNAVRESVLLEVCDAGIVFLPGAAGTVQEVFQDACENYYADEASVAPMVLVGVEHWTRTLPAWPLLQALARGRAMEPHVHLVDTVEEAAALVRGG